MTDNEQLHNIFMQAPAAIAVMSGPEHIFEFVNPRYLEITGKTNASIGKSMKEVFPELKNQGFYELVDAVYNTGKPFVGVEMPAIIQKSKTGDSVQIYVNLTYEPLRGPDGAIEAVVAHAVDVTEQVIARKQIEETEERYRTMFESLEEGLTVLNAAGIIVDANKSAERLLGLTVDQMRGRSSLDRRWKSVYEDGRPMYGKDHAPQHVLRTKKAYSNQIMGIHKVSGETTWLMVNAQPIMHGTTLRGIVASFFDITERKQAEDALQQQLEVTNTVAKTASSCLFMIDNNGLVTFLNPAAEAVTGYSRKFAIGKPMHSLVHHSYPDGSEYPEIDCPLVSTYKRGTPNPPHEDIFFKKDGTPFPALISGTPIPDKGGVRSTVVEFRDLTEEKKAIQTLAESEARLRFMSESMPQKVFTATADGNVDYFNEEWTKFTGLSFEQIRDWGWTQFIHPDDVDENIRVWKASIKTGKPFRLEHRFRRHDGAYHWHLSRARPMRDEQGHIVRWFGSNTDIEEIKNTTKRKNELEDITAVLKEQRAQLVLLNQAKDEFISLASHQLRTPASATKQFLGMVLEGYAGELQPAQREMLERARDTNERQILIVNDLLMVAQVDAGKVRLKKSAVNMVQLVEDVLVDQASKFIGRDQKISFIHKQASLKAKVDIDRMRMVLENLIDNASKYTPAGKNLTITLAKGEGKVRIGIKDEGVGMSKKDLARLFRKFSRFDNPLSASVGGTGLGLYWAKKIIDLHGGTVTVTSTEGLGSTFTVTLPI